MKFRLVESVDTKILKMVNLRDKPVQEGDRLVFVKEFVKGLYVKNPDLKTDVWLTKGKWQMKPNYHSSNSPADWTYDLPYICKEGGDSVGATANSIEEIKDHYTQKGYTFESDSNSTKYLKEDIVAVRKNYPNISDEDFNRLIRLDPTFVEGKDSVGTYGKWILTLFNKGKLTNEGHLTDVLTRFEENKKYLKNKDIGQFKSLEDVDNYLNDESNYNSLSHRQEVRQRQNDRKNTDVNKDATLVYEGTKWQIWIPKTYAASCKLGQGSSWCTASTESDYYYNSYTREGNLYICINKTNPEEKYQLHFESGSYMDIDDYSIDLGGLMRREPELMTGFTPIFIKELGLPEGTKMTDKIDIVADRSTIVNGLDEMSTSYRGDLLSNDVVCALIFEPWELDWWVDDSVKNSLNWVVDRIDEKNNNTLIGILGEGYTPTDIFENDEVYDAFNRAYSDAYEVGTQDLAHREAVKQLEYVTKGTYDEDTESLHCVATPAEMLNVLFDNSEYDTYAEISPEIYIMRLISTEYELREPRYGWWEFDDDTFNVSLSDCLAEITQ